MSILEEALAMKRELVIHRRYLHAHAEVGLDLPATSAYVIKSLEQMGLEPQLLGTSGVVALIRGKRPGKVFLLRADIDALPIPEESDLEFRCTSGNMHGCGHDFHAAMLLGAARILKAHAAELKGAVKLMFQPGEETLAGAKMMIELGVLKNPGVDAAMMVHVLPAVPISAGTAVFIDAGKIFATVEAFRVDVRGKGCHGSAPYRGVDPLNVLAHIHIALQEINAREITPFEAVTLTIGQMHGGTAANVVPETAYIAGTLRAQSADVHDFVKRRMGEIVRGIAAVFRAEAKLTFEWGCPGFSADEALNEEIMTEAVQLLGENRVIHQRMAPIIEKGLGGEDFSFIAAEVPAICVMLAAGSPEDGYQFAVHHPQVHFDEDALPFGAALLAGSALNWLSESSHLSEEKVDKNNT